MKNIKPFGPSIGKTKISKRFITKLNEEFDKKSNYRKIDYSSNHLLIRQYFQVLYHDVKYHSYEDIPIQLKYKQQKIL